MNFFGLFAAALLVNSVGYALAVGINSLLDISEADWSDAWMKLFIMSTVWACFLFGMQAVK